MDGRRVLGSPHIHPKVGEGVRVISVCQLPDRQLVPSLPSTSRPWGARVLTLDPDLLQLRHFGNGFLQVLHKLLHLVRAQGTEMQHLLLLRARERGHQGDAMRVIWKPDPRPTGREQQRVRHEAGASAACLPPPASYNPQPPLTTVCQVSGAHWDLHSFSKRWNCMPSRPADLQNVYAEELFFFGQSLRICPRGRQRRTDGYYMCVHTWLCEPPGIITNTQQTHTQIHAHLLFMIHAHTHIHIHTHINTHSINFFFHCIKPSSGDSHCT